MLFTNTNPVATADAIHAHGRADQARDGHAEHGLHQNAGVAEVATPIDGAFGHPSLQRRTFLGGKHLSRLAPGLVPVLALGAPVVWWVSGGKTANMLEG